MQESFWRWQCSDRYTISLSLGPRIYPPVQNSNEGHWTGSVTSIPKLLELPSYVNCNVYTFRQSPASGWWMFTTGNRNVEYCVYILLVHSVAWTFYGVFKKNMHSTVCSFSFFLLSSSFFLYAPGNQVILVIMPIYYLGMFEYILLVHSVEYYDFVCLCWIVPSTVYLYLPRDMELYIYI